LHIGQDWTGVRRRRAESFQGIDLTKTSSEVPVLLRFKSKRGLVFNAISTGFSLPKTPLLPPKNGPKHGVELSKNSIPQNVAASDNSTDP
jgi:hypothetical protein